MTSKLLVGDKVTFNTDKVEEFKKETTSDKREIQQYQKIVLAGINQVGTVKLIGDPLTTVSFADGWEIPIPTKYLLVLPNINNE